MDSYIAEGKRVKPALVPGAAKGFHPMVHLEPRAAKGKLAMFIQVVVGDGHPHFAPHHLLGLLIVNRRHVEVYIARAPEVRPVVVAGRHLPLEYRVGYMVGVQQRSQCGHMAVHLRGMALVAHQNGHYLHGPVVIDLYIMLHQTLGHQGRYSLLAGHSDKHLELFGGIAGRRHLLAAQFAAQQRQQLVLNSLFHLASSLL